MKEMQEHLEKELPKGIPTEILSWWVEKNFGHATFWKLASE